MSSTNYSTPHSTFSHTPSTFYQLSYGKVYAAHQYVTIRGTTYFIENLHDAGVPGALTYKGTVYFPQSTPSNTPCYPMPPQKFKHDESSAGGFAYRLERPMDSRSVPESDLSSDSELSV